MTAAAAAAASAAASAAAVAAAAAVPPPFISGRAAPTGGSQVRPRATVRPPPTERLGLAYFPPLVAPTPVATRVPQPAKTEDTINGFLRLEAAGGVLRPDGILFDMALILHAYANNTEESLAEDLIDEAIAWGSNAAGYAQQLDGDTWYITYSRCTSLAMRKADPLVNMTRYRAMITWRIPGIAVAPGTRAVRRGRLSPPPPPGAPRQSQAPRPSRRR